MYTICETCGKVVEVERVHNGVCYCWHYVHCGWGHDSAGDDDVFNSSEEAQEAQQDDK